MANRAPPGIAGFSLPLRTRAVAKACIVVASLALLSACAGNVVGSLEGGGPLANGEGGIGGGGGGGSPSGAGEFFGATGAAESSALHRLNSAEYDNSVRDLLGTKLTFGAKFLDDETANGFDNNAASLSVSSSRLQDYQLAAEALAIELATNANGQRDKLAPCAAGAQPATCLKAFVSSWGQKAWRRPLTPEEVGAVVSIAQQNNAAPYAQQLQQATVALLMSPYFLYRVELGAGPGNSKLSAYELAARLSYFLWSTTPDDELLSAAADASLLDDETLTAQVKRMLQDGKASAFSDNFTGQWLLLRGTEKYAPDSAIFPQFDEDLRASALAQTKATFNDLMVGRIAFHELFDGNTTYVNDRLAKHYGMPLPGSSTLVAVPAGERRGLLTQAAVLMNVSRPNRTSLVHRGVFMLHQVTCTHMPEAPANVPALVTTTDAAVTQRQSLASHATVKSCAVCHDLIDPYGFVLESYDATGAFRLLDNGGSIDTRTTMVDGTKVADVRELSQYLATSKVASSCMVQQLSTYALGRTLMETDAEQVNGLTAKFSSSGQRFDRLITSLILSPMFRQRT